MPICSGKKTEYLSRKLAIDHNTRGVRLIPRAEGRSKMHLQTRQQKSLRICCQKCTVSRTITRTLTFRIAVRNTNHWAITAAVSNYEVEGSVGKGQPVNCVNFRCYIVVNTRTCTLRTKITKSTFILEIFV